MTTGWRHDGRGDLRREAHFGARLVTCYAERPANVDAMLRAAAEAHGGRDALVDGDTRISHDALDALATRIAADLTARGLEAGDRVLLLAANRWEFAAVLLGGIRAGLIVVPVSTRSQRPELAYIAGDCGARAIVHDGALADILPTVDEAPALSLRLDLDGAAFQGLMKADGADFTPPPLAEDATAVILYTSGTTGRPKGAMLTHLNIVHSCLHFAECFAMTADDRSLMAVPASHVTGLIANVFSILSVGGALLILRKFDVAGFLALAEGEGITHTIMVPAMYNLLLLRAELSDHDLSGWRIGGFGGAQMPESTIARLAEKLPNLMLCNAYGATETTSPTTLMPPGVTERMDSVGLPVPCADVRIIDADGVEVPPGGTGEVWIAGPMVVPGYWNKPDKTAESFVGGYWRSGDVGSVDADGYLRVFDRLKDMINRGGYKIFSAEVENILAFHEAVAEVAVVPQADPVLGERVHAFIHPAPGADVEVEALRAYCAERLSDYKVPDGFTISEGPLPRNANGKLMKRELRERVLPHD
ncbi:acyl--CoA ligase [Marivibrio halodurans]|uniref:Acyl--CoA ligase n=1 Tax=Marivibrio halodurans TaxID=2039722 RepID=A0A8J7S4C8_9PROT|nr:class I adenylate-forming enzyme family protein [Marivibrio halodurans]MBP5855427.1 acyl--CoA ligase [Marivibrio halodurans]